MQDDPHAANLRRCIIKAVIARAVDDCYAIVVTEPPEKDDSTAHDHKIFMQRSHHWRKLRLERNDALDFMLTDRLFVFTDLLRLERGYVRDKIKELFPKGRALMEMGTIERPDHLSRGYVT